MKSDPENSFGIRPSRRTVLMIDGVSTAAACRALGWNIDFKKLLGLFDENTDLIRARYFSLLSSSAGDQSNGAEKALKSLLDFLAYNGFVVETRFVKAQDDGGSKLKLRGSVAVNIALKLVSDSRHAYQIVLFTGDGALVPAVEEAQRFGAHLTIVSTQEADSMSDSLRRQADRFVDLGDVRTLIEREKK